MQSSRSTIPYFGFRLGTPSAQQGGCGTQERINVMGLDEFSTLVCPREKDAGGLLLLEEWSSRKGLSASSGLEVSNPNIHGDAESSPLRSTGREACGRAERGCGGGKTIMWLVKFLWTQPTRWKFSSATMGSYDSMKRSPSGMILFILYNCLSRVGLALVV